MIWEGKGKLRRDVQSLGSGSVRGEKGGRMCVGDGSENEKKG